jgi:catechol 2,3-dioxygenase-like lactoylglutathione lyase family enzyme
MLAYVKFVSIPTSDQDRAVAFWTEKVGLTVMSDQPFSDKQRWIELAIANSPTRFVLFTPDGQEDERVATSPGRGGERPGDVRPMLMIGSFFNGALACDDLEATHRQLSERGVEFVKPPEKSHWGGFAIFRDPDGNQFVLSTR